MGFGGGDDVEWLRGTRGAAECDGAHTRGEREPAAKRAVPAQVPPADGGAGEASWPWEESERGGSKGKANPRLVGRDAQALPLT